VTQEQALAAPVLVTVAKMEFDHEKKIAKARIESNPIALLESKDLRAVKEFLEEDEYLAFSGATIAIGEFQDAKCVFADQRGEDAPSAPGAMHFNGGRSEYRFNSEESRIYWGGRYNLYSEILNPRITADWDGLIEENLYLLPDRIAIPFDPYVNHHLARNVVSGMYDAFQQQPYATNYKGTKNFQDTYIEEVCDDYWDLMIDWEGIESVTRQGHLFITGKDGIDLSYFKQMKFDCKIQDFLVVSMEMFEGKPLNHKVYAYELNDQLQLTTKILGYWQSAQWHPNCDPQDTILKHPTTEGFRQAMDVLGIAA